MCNIHIHVKVRVLEIGRNRNQKLCNLHALIINGRSITIGKVKILDNRGNFQQVENWKNVEFDFHIKFYKTVTNN